MQHHLPFILETTQSPHALLKPVALSAVKLTDRFWAPKLHTNRAISLREQHQNLTDTGRLDNFKPASGKDNLPYSEPVFNNSDVYKWLEAAAWSLAAEEDTELWLLVDQTITLVIQALGEKGYLNTCFAFDRNKQKFTNMHELFCAAHLIQAAIALARSMGDARLLGYAADFADSLVVYFDGIEQKLTIPLGHPEIVIALVELSRETADVRYLQLAQKFFDARSNGLIGGQEYHLDHQPFREMQRFTGHAESTLYLCSGAADIAIETGEERLHLALEHLWKNMTTHLMYFTEGVGAAKQDEAVGCGYELSNAAAYTETCASIALMMWAWRMLQLDAQCTYADHIEYVLYNAILPGVSLDGKTHFYTNPCSDDGSHRRESWCECTCSPSNISRTLAWLPGLIYSVSRDAVWVHQYAANEAILTLPGGDKVSILQRTRYPWDGNVIIEVLTNCAFSLNMRIPRWCDRNVEVNINGDTYTESVTPGTYVKIERSWSIGDSVCIQFSMPVRIMKAHPNVRENTGLVTLMRGPLVYCLEAVDHPNVNLMDIVLKSGQTFTASFQPELLQGVQIIEASANVENIDSSWGQVPDREKSEMAAQNSKPVKLTAIPYFTWGNREAGQMVVWLRESAKRMHE